MNPFFFFCVAQQRNAMGSHHDSYDIIRILHALEFSLRCARVCSESNKTRTSVRLSQMLTWNRDVYLGDSYGFKSVWCARLIKVNTLLLVPESVTNQQSQHVRFCKKKKPKPKPRRNKENLYKKSVHCLGCLFWIFRPRCWGSRPCLVTQIGGKRKTRKDTTRVANAGRSSAGRGSSRGTHSVDERRRASGRKLTDTHLHAWPGRAHTRPRTPYMYI